ncbi:MAG: hypothetical protein WC565_05000 [Parcubacteria group bacterium]
MATYLDDDNGADWNLYISRGFQWPEVGQRCVVRNGSTVSRAFRTRDGLFYECDDQWRDNGFTLKRVTKWRLPREGE